MSATRTIPWYIWCAMLAVTSVTIGGHWDISWHSSIGRDTFWTPAHMAIYLCGVLAGVAFGYLILATTFDRHSALRDASVNIWGFRAPLGAFIASWGGIAMLTSAPFDNWWHNAYGLDVKIVSPPHAVLFLGIYGVIFGTIVLVAAHTNRALGEARVHAQRALLYLNGIAVTLVMVLIEEYTNRPFLHSSVAYIALSVFVPGVLALSSRGSRHRFGAAIAASVYTGAIILAILILPLFPAEPKLGPVMQHVTHFVPPQFPILIIAPAFVLDWFWSRTKIQNQFVLAGVSALIYLAILIAAEWPFAVFLQSSMSENRFFGTMYYYYGAPPSSYVVLHKFWDQESITEFWQGLAIAAGIAWLSFWGGLTRGRWLQEVRR